MRGADLFVRTLVQAGVQHIFTLSGNQIMSVFDACIDQPLPLIHVRHEAAAVHMADACGRLAGQPGVALVTAGPGFANTLSALYVARMACSPLVLISGAAPHSRAGQGAFQDMPQAEMSQPVVKAAWHITEPAELGHAVARAFRTALAGRPGPVHLCVPGEVFEAVVETARGTVPQPEDFFPPVSLLDNSTAETVLETLARAEHPLILAGPVPPRDAFEPRLQELAERLNIPAVIMESPRGIKDPSLGRFREKLAEADVVLLLSRPLDFALRFGETPPFRSDCRFLMIDPEMPTIEQAGRNLQEAARLPVTALADPLPAVERLLQKAEEKHRRKDNWREECETAVSFRPAEWVTLSSPPEGPLHPAELCRTLHNFLTEHAGENAVFVSDGGEFGQWAQACISAPRRIINGASGSIGGGIPFASAARLMFPEAPVLSTVGDGTFGFHAMEFDTAIRHNLPAVVVVGNDACWNAERQIQLRDYGPERLIGCDLLPTPYGEVVRALGGHGEEVTRPDQLRPALERAFASGKPACVNVAIQSIAAPE